MSRFKKLIPLLLCLCMVCGGLVSCNNGKDRPAPVTQEPEETTLLGPLAHLPERDYKDRYFTILTRDKVGTTSWAPVDISFDSTVVGDAINDAVYKRNSLVENKYHIVIRQQEEDDSETALRNSVLSNLPIYDAACITLQKSAVIALEGGLYDLADVSVMDLERDYWDASGNSYISLGHRLYFAMGNLNIVDDNATWCVLFNKFLADKYNLDDQYEQVRYGDWTVEAMYEYGARVATDLGNNGMTTDDIWGILEQNECMIAYLGGSGLLTVVKDEKDMPLYNFESAIIEETIYKLHGLMNRRTVSLNVNRLKVSNQWSIAPTMFTNNQSLYYTTTVTSIGLAQFRDMKSAFGILPIPKLTSEQEFYYSAMQGNNGTAISIPCTVSADESGLILEAMSAASTNTLTKTYYDTLLQRRYVKDDQSAEMLDIIFAHRIIDTAFIFNWADIRWVVQDVAEKADYTYSNRINSMRSDLEGRIGATIKLLEKLN